MIEIRKNNYQTKYLTTVKRLSYLEDPKSCPVSLYLDSCDF